MKKHYLLFCTFCAFISATGEKTAPNEANTSEATPMFIQIKVPDNLSININSDNDIILKWPGKCVDTTYNLATKADLLASEDVPAELKSGKYKEIVKKSDGTYLFVENITGKKIARFMKQAGNFLIETHALYLTFFGRRPLCKDEDEPIVPRVWQLPQSKNTFTCNDYAIPYQSKKWNTRPRTKLALITGGLAGATAYSFSRRTPAGGFIAGLLTLPTLVTAAAFSGIFSQG